VNNLKTRDKRKIKREGQARHQMLMMRLPSAITANANARHTVSVARSCGIRSRIFFPSAEAEAGLRIRDAQLNATETMEGNQSTEAGVSFGTRQRQVLFTETSNTRLTEGALRSRSLRRACFDK
jgi:hypothetical protein